MIGGAFMALFLIRYRTREAARPLNARKIIIPPLAMSTGAFMYVVPVFRPNGVEIVESVLLGLFFSLFLIATTKLERRDAQVWLKPSRAFLFVLLALFAIRFALKTFLRQTIAFETLSGMFFLLAFAMILAWRVVMYREYRRLATLTE